MRRSENSDENASLSCDMHVIKLFDAFAVGNLLREKIMKKESVTNGAYAYVPIIFVRNIYVG